MEWYFERVVERLTTAGYRWYETANFCRPGAPASAADYRARHNLAYWLGRDYLGLGIGAVSTVGGRRWRNKRSLARYAAALAGGSRPPREEEMLSDAVIRLERLMLGLRLEEGVAFAEVDRALDLDALRRLERLGLAERRGQELVLTRRGRFLGGGVTAELLAQRALKPCKRTI
jgi:oxygen-independent coproporphyrinogen-3 oxidase